MHATTIDIFVNVDQANESETWSCIEQVLAICVTGS
jgi:hypothetical protein